MKIVYGCTRLVILTKRYAIKMPQFKFHWNHFLLGLLANIQEYHFSKVKNEERVCPVIFYICGGFMLIMPRCKEISQEDFLRINKNTFWPIKDNERWIYQEKSFFPEEYIDRNDDYNIPVEYKQDSFGWYKGRIVAIDYGS